ncbi:hypothetical protein GCM10007874_41440 [Labrys miyagiensis]|uniref:Winged helix-turn helix domain-containing protein n=1 Tax=Labrys miyagiensis TaxID=346912 RepID=A0ABQ6CNB2_9HYPH|nr:winged helix-turn-helix domain-containing protein [Labrys miyagiensis]GLS21127.1 hypothetical protein GCM10007874_41440 [Labrys miyagiensis]
MEPLFKVSLSYIYKAAARRRETGEVCARPQRNHVPPKLADHEDALRAKLEANPDARIVDLRAWAKTELGVAISHARMWHMLRRLGLTYKKRRSMPANKSAPMSRRRAASGAAAKSG